MKSYFQKNIKRLIRRCGLILSILLLAPITSQAKSSSRIRGLLNHLHFNFSMGYGKTSYQNHILNYSVFVKEGNYYLYNPLEGTQTGYLLGWFNNPNVLQRLYESESFLADLKKQANGTQAIIFYGSGDTFPFTLSGHVDIKKKWRVEVGGSIYLHKISQLVPAAQYKDLGSYSDSKGMHYMSKVFLRMGHKLLENTAYSLLLDTQISCDFLYGSLKDASAISSNLLSPAVGIGVTFEKHISEYLSVFGKITYEKIKLTNAMNSTSKGAVISHRENVLLQIGVTINWPEIPRCPVPGCKIEVKHRHGEMAYRGVSIPTGENSLGYKLYKK